MKKLVIAFGVATVFALTAVNPAVASQCYPVGCEPPPCTTKLCPKY